MEEQITNKIYIDVQTSQYLYCRISDHASLILAYLN